MTVDGVWGEGHTPCGCECGARHELTHYLYSPNKKVRAHFKCRSCGVLIQIELPGALISVREEPRQD